MMLIETGVELTTNRVLDQFDQIELALDSQEPLIGLVSIHQTHIRLLVASSTRRRQLVYELSGVVARSMPRLGVVVGRVELESGEVRAHELVQQSAHLCVLNLSARAALENELSLRLVQVVDPYAALGHHETSQLVK